MSEKAAKVVLFCRALLNHRGEGRRKRAAKRKSSVISPTHLLSKESPVRPILSNTCGFEKNRSRSERVEQVPFSPEFVFSAPNRALLLKLDYPPLRAALQQLTMPLKVSLWELKLHESKCSEIEMKPKQWFAIQRVLDTVFHY